MPQQFKGRTKKSGKIGKNTEGVTSGCFDVKYDCKKIKKLFYNYKKKEKRKKTLHRTLYSRQPPPKAHTQNPNRRRYA
jgi:hypothetical protein